MQKINTSIKTKPEQTLQDQKVRDVGMGHLLYELLNKGWTVSKSSKDEKGIHIWIENNTSSIKTKHSIQVRCIEGRHSIWITCFKEIDNLSFGTTLDILSADFVIACTWVKTNTPQFYIIPIKKIQDRIKEYEKDGKPGYWLRIKDYSEFLDNWKVLT